MATWTEFEQEAPELAQRVRERLEAGRHKTMATLRRDGSPRISGTEVEMTGGELWIGSMWQALKARDLQRDPRFAIHAMPNDPEAFDGGDAKIAGIAEEITDPAVVQEHNGHVTEEPSHLFRLDLREASVVRHNDAKDALVIEVWRPGEGVRRMERA